MLSVGVSSVDVSGRLRVGQDSLSHAGLIHGCGITVIWTEYPEIDHVHLTNVVYEHYHVHDSAYLRVLSDGSLTPTAERALVDCMIWQDHNYDEGFLIEALQSYQYDGHQASDLYEVADHYLLPHEVVDYWWNEALEEDDMSMG